MLYLRRVRTRISEIHIWKTTGVNITPITFIYLIKFAMSTSRCKGLILDGASLINMIFNAAAD